MAGLETYERLHHVAQVSFELLTHRLDWRLVTFDQGLQTALASFAPRYHDLDQGAVWLRDIADILGPTGNPSLSAARVEFEGHLYRRRWSTDHTLGLRLMGVRSLDREESHFYSPVELCQVV